MLRRQARLRREYLYRKSNEDKHNKLQEKKDRLKRSLDEGIPIHGDLRKEALSLQDKLKWNDEGKCQLLFLIFTILLNVAILIEFKDLKQLLL